ncbi:hypothetical protein JCM3766R1_002793 [Sporobolomyces carnicolor]
MSPKLQRRVSRILHLKGAVVKPSDERLSAETSRASTPRTPIRSRPTFSLSSFSLRRPSVTSTSSILTPPLTPSPPSSATAESDPEESNSDDDDQQRLEIRNPPPSLLEPEPRRNARDEEPVTSYFDFSPSHWSHLVRELSPDRLHAQSAPPSPLSTRRSRSRSHLAGSILPSETSSASVSSIGVDEQVEPNEPHSAFSDWGTSVGGCEGGDESRNLSSRESFSSSRDERGSVTAMFSRNEVVSSDDTGGRVEDDDQGSERSIAATSLRGPAKVATDPARVPRQPPPHVYQQPHHHQHHHHHQRRHHANVVLRDSTVADSSYPELAVAFFLGLNRKRQCLKKDTRRASTGSLGGAV